MNNIKRILMLMVVLSVFICGAFLATPAVDAAKVIDKGRLYASNGAYFDYFTTYYHKNYLHTEIYYNGLYKTNEIKVGKKGNKLYRINERVYSSSGFREAPITHKLNTKNSVKWYYNKYMKKSLKNNKLPSNTQIGTPSSKAIRWGGEKSEVYVNKAVTPTSTYKISAAKAKTIAKKYFNKKGKKGTIKVYKDGPQWIAYSHNKKGDIIWGIIISRKTGKILMSSRGFQ